MKRIILSVVLLLVASYSFSQDIVKVEKGDDLTKVINEIYLFPEFIDGRILNKDNSMATGKLNYNTLLSELQFVQGKDTLSIVNQNNINIVMLGKRTLVNVKNGFAEVLQQNGAVQFAVKKKINVKNPPKAGAYGIRSESTGIDTYSSITNGEVAFADGSYNYLTNSEVEIFRETIYYLINDSKVYVANKKGFLKTFSKNKQQVENYLKENKVNFNNEDDLKQLFNYCVNL